MTYNREQLIELFSKDPEYKFKELSSRYPYSVSKIVSQFKKEFEKEKMAEYCSNRDKDNPSGKYYGKTPSDILNEWEESAEIAKQAGRDLDDYIGSILDPENNHIDISEDLQERSLKKMHMFDDFYKTMGNFDFVIREHQLLEDNYKVNGRFDAMFMKGDNIILVDWKNNDEISTVNKFDKLYGPLYKYDASDLNSYTIQLYVYKYILKNKYHIDNNIIPVLVQFGSDTYHIWKPQIPYSDELVESIFTFAIEKLNKIKVPK